MGKYTIDGWKGLVFIGGYSAYIMYFIQRE